MADLRHKDSLRAVEMSVAEYLADPRRATEEAERAGYVLVKDEGGMTCLVVSSNRATEALGDDPAMPAPTDDRGAACLAWLKRVGRNDHPLATLDALVAFVEQRERSAVTLSQAVHREAYEAMDETADAIGLDRNKFTHTDFRDAVIDLKHEHDRAETRVKALTQAVELYCPVVKTALAWVETYCSFDDKKDGG